MAYQVVFYTKPNGRAPIDEFLFSLDPKTHAKVNGALAILEEKGPQMREPFSKHLKDGIFELRCRNGSMSVRILYFFHKESVVVLTNGFVKKDRKTPLRELILAESRRREYLSSCNEK